MAYITAEARQQLLDDLAGAIEALGTALASLGAAYELLDDQTADRVEEQLFRPGQAASGRPARPFPPARAGSTAHGAGPLLDRAVESVEEAEDALVELQDSMMPVEV